MRGAVQCTLPRGARVAYPSAASPAGRQKVGCTPQAQPSACTRNARAYVCAPRRPRTPQIPPSTTMENRNRQETLERLRNSEWRGGGGARTGSEERGCVHLRLLASGCRRLPSPLLCAPACAPRPTEQGPPLLILLCQAPKQQHLWHPCLAVRSGLSLPPPCPSHHAALTTPATTRAAVLENLQNVRPVGTSFHTRAPDALTSDGLKSERAGGRTSECGEEERMEGEDGL